MEIAYLRLGRTCGAAIRGYRCSARNGLAHEGCVCPRRPGAAMVIKPRGLDVVIRGAIAAVGNIRDEIIVFAVVAPAPPSATWCEDDWVEPVPGHRTRPAVSRVVGVLIVLIAQLQHPVQFLLADAAIGAILSRAALPVPIRCGPVEPSLGGAEPIAFDRGSVFRIG